MELHLDVRACRKEETQGAAPVAREGRLTHRSTYDIHVLCAERGMLARAPAAPAECPQRKALVHDEAESIFVLQAGYVIKRSKVAESTIDALDNNEAAIQRLPVAPRRGC